MATTLYPGGPAINLDGSFTVRTGDWLSKYSQGIDGTFDHVPEFYRSNGTPPEKIPDPDLIEVGWKLWWIPTKASPIPEEITDKKIALGHVNAFAARTGPQAFLRIERQRVAEGLTARVNHPNRVNQRGALLCGPAKMVRLAAEQRPIEYVLFVIDLFEKGKGTLGEWVIEPGEMLKNYRPPLGRDPDGIQLADWIPMASIRDSENWLWPHADIKSNGGTYAYEMVRWLRQSGYTFVRDASSPSTESETHLRVADLLQRTGHKVLLLIDANVLEPPANRPAKKQMDHVVVLTTPISFIGSGATGRLDFNVYTWGREMQMIPRGSLYMRTDDFLRHYYGFIAARL